MTMICQLDRSTREVELGLEYGPPAMNLGGQTLKFEDGQWITESGGHSSGREVQRLKKRNLQLEEENNLLKLKIETLLDMCIFLITKAGKTPRHRTKGYQIWLSPPALHASGLMDYNDSKFFFLFLLYQESGVREVQALERRNLELEEENNLLKLKIETLLDMVRM
ncbi:Protein chibby -like protein 1 ARPP-binding protein [Takifugu flavidus]|uniref:Protein chibby-like protein 1 ARPP-binding protein n=1 Tax=Takifugu flavidus TaxID=433684 RepID=A0A5C6PNX1_9TELE|nr:Protein chibby -like protein 1 ARPP-binding protein [Takifugu flavidus]